MIKVIRKIFLKALILQQATLLLRTLDNLGKDSSKIGPSS